MLKRRWSLIDWLSLETDQRRVLSFSHRRVCCMRWNQSRGRWCSFSQELYCSLIGGASPGSSLTSAQNRILKKCCCMNKGKTTLTAGKAYTMFQIVTESFTRQLFPACPTSTVACKSCNLGLNSWLKVIFKGSSFFLAQEKFCLSNLLIRSFLASSAEETRG